MEEKTGTTKVDEPKANRETENVAEVRVRPVFFTRGEWRREGEYRKETMIMGVLWVEG